MAAMDRLTGWMMNILTGTMVSAHVDFMSDESRTILDR